MRTNMTKNEKVLAVIGVIAVSAFFGLFLRMNFKPKAASQVSVDPSINYQMARPTPGYSEYNLDGRELDQTYEALAQKKKQTKETAVETKKAELIAKQKAETKKQQEAKKKQQQSAQKPKASEVKAQAAVSRPEKDTRPELFSTESQPAPGASAIVTNYGGAAPVAQAAQAPVPKPATEVKKTFAEWRAIIMAAPTAENMALFVAALRKNEVTAEEYQALAQELLSQPDVNLKGLGLMALRSVPSLASLSQLAHLDANSISGYQSYVDQALNAYLLPANVQYLNQALQTTDKVLIVKTLSMLNSNLESISQGDLTSLAGPRSARGDGIEAFSMSSYDVLMPNLNRLLESNDPDLAAMAQRVASIIQRFGNVARN